MTPDPSSTFRIMRARVAGLLFAGLALLVGLSMLVVGTLGDRLFGSVLALVGVLLAWRVLRAGVRVGPAGLTYTRLWGSDTYTWEQIRHADARLLRVPFEPGERRVPVLTLVGGIEVVLKEFTAIPKRGEDEADVAQVLVAEINRRTGSD